MFVHSLVGLAQSSHFDSRPSAFLRALTSKADSKRTNERQKRKQEQDQVREQSRHYRRTQQQHLDLVLDLDLDLDFVVHCQSCTLLLASPWSLPSRLFAFDLVLACLHQIVDGCPQHCFTLAPLVPPGCVCVLWSWTSPVVCLASTTTTATRERLDHFICSNELLHLFSSLFSNWQEQSTCLAIQPTSQPSCQRQRHSSLTSASASMQVSTSASRPCQANNIRHHASGTSLRWSIRVVKHESKRAR